MKTVKYLTLSFLILLMAATVSSAYQLTKTSSGVMIKWSTPSVSYVINPTGGPAGSDAAISSAMQTWSSVQGTSFRFSSMTSNTTTCTGGDSLNRICFGKINETGVLAQNQFWYNVSTGFIVESDIVFNTNYAWATNGSAAAHDVQSVATHEFGHTLSLADLYSSADTEKTMYGYANAGETKKRSLDPDDMAGIVFIYPSSSGGTTPTNCTYFVSPSSISVPASGSTGSISITTQTGCTWSVSNPLSWVSFSAASGSGSATINYSVSANTTTSTRSGSISAAGKTVIIAQAAQADALILTASPMSVNFGNVIVGRYSSAKVIVNITGSVNAISGIISGTNARNFSANGTCSATSTGYSCAITVGFFSTSKGVKTATLTVLGSSASGKNARVLIPLSGTVR